MSKLPEISHWIDPHDGHFIQCSMTSDLFRIYAKFSQTEEKRMGRDDQGYDL
jgi:hypothetical protein